MAAGPALQMVLMAGWTPGWLATVHSSSFELRLRITGEVMDCSD